MKKICPECDSVNDYENDICEKCGCDLNKSVKYKMCPYCGREYEDLNKKECDDCRYELIVRGRPAAQIFDEKQKREISPLLRVLCIVLPVIGIIIAVLFVILKDEKDLQPETAKTFILTTVFVQLVLIGTIILFAMLLSGSSFSLMRNLYSKG